MTREHHIPRRIDPDRSVASVVVEGVDVLVQAFDSDGADLGREGIRVAPGMDDDDLVELQALARRMHRARGGGAGRQLDLEPSAVATSPDQEIELGPGMNAPEKAFFRPRPDIDVVAQVASRPEALAWTL